MSDIKKAPHKVKLKQDKDGFIYINGNKSPIKRDGTVDAKDI